MGPYLLLPEAFVT